MLSALLDNPYFQNVASEFIALLLLVLGGLALYHATGRRRLLRFFNIHQTKTVAIYFSNVFVPTGGSVGVDGVARSFSGSAIPLSEVHLVPAFQRLFNLLIPGADSLPGFLKYLILSGITVNVMASPGSRDDLERSSSIIAIGSPGYNRASEHIETAFHSFARFVSDNRALQLSSNAAVTDPQAGFVQKAVDQVSGQVAFYVAGPSAIGTSGAALYLVTHWKRLAKRYPRNTPFCVMVRTTSQDGRHHEVLYER
jgi:hypothetical protein